MWIYDFAIAEGACFESSIDYGGSSSDNIEDNDGNKYVTVDSAKDCQLSCQALSNCKVWTYATGGTYSKRCWRKSQKVKHEAQSYRTSGQKFCGLKTFGFLGVTLKDNERVSYFLETIYLLNTINHNFTNTYRKTIF